MKYKIYIRNKEQKQKFRDNKSTYFETCCTKTLTIVENEEEDRENYKNYINKFYT